MKRLLLLVAFLCAAPLTLWGQQQPSPSPELYIAANNSQELNLYLGWPLIIHATILNSLRFNSNSSNAPLVIAPNGQAWTSAIQFTAVSSSGQMIQWPLALVGAPVNDSLTLNPTDYVFVMWQMSAGDVSALPPDTYQLTATLQVANSNGWNGTVQSAPVSIQVGPEPTLTADQQSLKALLITEYYANAGDLKAAQDTAQQNLDAQPNDPVALAAVANLVEMSGEPQLAYFLTNNAVMAYIAANPTPFEEPFNLWTMYDRQFASMITTGVEAPTTLLVSNESLTFSLANQNVTLTATVSTPSSSVDGGTVSFAIVNVGTPVPSKPVAQGAASAVLSVPGGTHAGSYGIEAAYSGTPSFEISADAAHTLTIAKATPVITWNPATSVPAGTALSSAQLNATASVPGTFVYNPPAGTILASSTQTLSVTFMPTDSMDYNSASATATLMVLAGSFSGSVSPTSVTVHVGSSKSFNVTITSNNFVGAVSLSCPQPPAGISCQFAPNQVNLSANGSSTTVLTVSVNAKPAVILAPRSLPASPRGQFVTATWLTLACLVLFMCLTLIGNGRLDSHAGSHPDALPYALVLLLLLSISLSSCSCVVGSGGCQQVGSGGGPGGGSSPANVSLVVQGTSGATTVKLGTVSISVP